MGWRLRVALVLRLSPEQPDLDIFGHPLIAVSIGEKVAVNVIGHLDRAVPHERLNGFRVFPCLDPQRGAGVP